MIKIIDTQLQTSYRWNDINQRTPTWQNMKNECAGWRSLVQTTLIAQQINIEVDLVENNWVGVTKLYPAWQSVKSDAGTWQGLKTF